MKIGNGFDVHRLVEGRPLILGGVHIPHTHGLLGHSDADVVAHALCDAVLGAAGEPDIGRLFPPDDEQYRGADSIELLRTAMARVRAKGFRFVSGDIVVMAERPLLSPHLRAMRTRLAEGLGATMDDIGLKATTTEKLGFTGREEGIAASAVVLLERIR